MTTQCNKCGDCCERITVSWDPTYLLKFVNVVDPRTDAGWERWRAKGYKDEDRDGYARTWLNANFMFEHWQARDVGEGHTQFKCEMFDPATRLCTAHDDRPPICSGFPWYGWVLEERGPLEKAARLMHFRGQGAEGGLPRCEFWADVEPELRPEGWEPVLMTTRPLPAGTVDAR